MLAPARETSIVHHEIVPLKTPVRVIVNAFTRLERERRELSQTGREDPGPSDNNNKASANSDIPHHLISAFSHLSETLQHLLFTDKPLGSHTSPPQFHTAMISLVKRHGDLIQFVPQAEHKKLLQEALHDAEVREAELKGQLRGKQAALVLQNVFCDQLRNEIHRQENKLKKKDRNVAVKVKEANKRCRLLTDPELIELYAQHQAEIEAKATEKEKKKDAREKHEEALKTWKAGEEERKRQCAEINAKYHAALEAWKEEREHAKQEKR